VQLTNTGVPVVIAAGNDIEKMEHPNVGVQVRMTGTRLTLLGSWYGVGGTRDCKTVSRVAYCCHPGLLQLQYISSLPGTRRIQHRDCTLVPPPMRSFPCRPGRIRQSNNSRDPHANVWAIGKNLMVADPEHINDIATATGSSYAAPLAASLIAMFREDPRLCKY
jgi:hypothetical protein